MQSKPELTLGRNGPGSESLALKDHDSAKPTRHNGAASIVTQPSQKQNGIIVLKAFWDLLDEMVNYEDVCPKVTALLV